MLVTFIGVCNEGFTYGYVLTRELNNHLFSPQLLFFINYERLHIFVLVTAIQ